MTKIIFIIIAILLPFHAYPQIFTEDFEDGNYTSSPAWDLWLQNTNCCTDTTISVNASAARTGSYGVDIYYVLDDDPRGDCVAHQDNNTCLQYTTDSITHGFMRGYFKLPLTEAEFCNSTAQIQRKILYFKQSDNMTLNAFMIPLWPWGTGCNDDEGGYNVSVGYGNAAGTGTTLWGDNAADGFLVESNHVRRNVWYYIEVEWEFRTYGTDILRIWLASDGDPAVKIFERTNLALRTSDESTSGTGIILVEVGRQVDLTRIDSGGEYIPAIAEHRYWDDIVLSEEYIGASTPRTATGVTISGATIH